LNFSRRWLSSNACPHDDEHDGKGDGLEQLSHDHSLLFLREDDFTVEQDSLLNTVGGQVAVVVNLKLWHFDASDRDENPGSHYILVVLDEILQLLLIFFSLGILHREHTHEEIGRVLEPGHLHVHTSEVTWTFFRIVLEYNVSIGHQDKAIKEGERSRTGLMNGADHGFALAGQFLANLDDLLRHETVETRGGLVEEDHGRVSDEGLRDRGSLSFSCGNRLLVNCADLFVSTCVQSQVSDELVNAIILIVLTNFQLQASRKCENLLNCESFEEHVVLHDIGGVLSKQVGGKLISVIEFDAPREFLHLISTDPVTQTIQK